MAGKINPFPALVTSYNVHSSVAFSICQKDGTGHPAQILIVHACTGEVQFYKMNIYIYMLGLTSLQEKRSHCTLKFLQSILEFSEI